MTHALIPGSFDPMTLGHLDIVKRARAHYDKVSVAVLINESKKYLFSLEERAQIVRLSLQDMPDVEVISDTGLLVDLFDRVGADVIVKGVRNEKDRIYEEQMAAANLQRNPKAKTVFMQAADDYEQVSSTRVREMLKNGESLEEVVASAAVPYLLSCLG